MFELLADIDTDADEATLVECIAELEHLKCVAAAGQVRLTAALDQKRRAREAADGVPAAKRGHGLASEIAWLVMTRPTAVVATWGLLVP